MERLRKALAAPAHAPAAAAAQAATSVGLPGEEVPGNAAPPMPEALAPKRPAHYLWAFAASLRSSQ